jgi:carbamoyl-phosphate synthase small subunit
MNNEVEQIRELVKTSVPTFGICFGHQLLGRAFGGKTFKLTFGHRGGNQPVQDLASGGVEITSHNHGFAVEAGSLPGEMEVTHINLNDRCVEGMRHTTLPIISVQYHPEAAPGPHDAEHHFQRFIQLMQSART